MAELTLTSDSYNGRFLRLECSQTQDIANNKSTITWTLTSSGGTDNYYTTGPTTVTINGQQVYYKDRTKWTTYEFPAARGSTSGNLVVDHTSNGTKSISVSLSTVIYYADSAVKTVSQNWQLDAISRKATITSAPNFTDVGNPVLRYSNPAGNTVTSLKACISLTGSKDDIAYRDVPKTGTSYTFSLTEAERNILRNNTTGNSRTVYFYLRTGIGDDYHYAAKDVTFSISNGEPIITASVIDVNPNTVYLTGDNNKLVKFFSNAQATMTAVAQKGASIDEISYIIHNGNSTRHHSSSYTFNGVEDNTFTFSAEDSRGNVGETDLTPEMVAYIKPTCHISNNRPDVFGNMTVSCHGDYFNQSFGAVNNTLTVQYRYKVSGGAYSSWTSMTATKSGNTYYASADFVIPNFDQNLYYDFETQAFDQLATATSVESSVKSVPVFHWGENDFVFEVPVTFNAGVNNSGTASTISDDQTIDGDLNVTGDLRLKGSGNYGNKLRFGDGDYCYIDEPSDDVMTIHAKQINLDATNGVYVNAKSMAANEAGLWTPTISASVSPVSSYSVRQGWYQKVGQCVTVGFQIKANISSGYEGYSFLIAGLPFTPLYNAFGGGIAHNIYVTAVGYVFEGWCANTDGNITGRLQPGNNTSAGNLQIASTTYFPSGGGTMTLSGTICYLTNE